MYIEKYHLDNLNFWDKHIFDNFKIYLFKHCRGKFLSNNKIKRKHA